MTKAESISHWCRRSPNSPTCLLVAAANRLEMCLVVINRMAFEYTEQVQQQLKASLKDSGVVIHSQTVYNRSETHGGCWYTFNVYHSQLSASFNGHYYHFVRDADGHFCARPVIWREMGRFFLERSESWDSATCDCGWDTIDLIAVGRLRFGAAATPEIYAQLTQAEAEAFLTANDLMRDGRFTRAALLLTRKRPQDHMHLYDAYARIGFGDDMGNSSEVMKLGDCILAQYGQLIRLLPRYLGRDLREDDVYPRSMLHEVIVNALAHRNYTIPGDVHVRVRRDGSAVIVSNTGSLPDGLQLGSGAITNGATEKDLGFRYECGLYTQEQVMPIWRNPLIAHGLHLAGLMHAQGEGLHIIRVAAERCDRQVVSADDRFVVRFEDRQARKQAQRFSAFTARQQVILRWVEAHGSVTNAKVRELVGCSDETARVEVKVLVEKGVLRAEGALR